MKLLELEDPENLLELEVESAQDQLEFVSADPFSPDSQPFLSSIHQTLIFSINSTSWPIPGSND